MCYDPNIKCKEDEFWCTRKAECVKKITDCYKSHQVLGKTISRRNLDEDGDNGCPADKPNSCYDGTCVENPMLCPTPKPCKIMEVRCGDGKCHPVREDDNSVCEGVENITCASGKQPCEDGLCHKVCPPHDGCPLNQVLCPNGKW